MPGSKPNADRSKAYKNTGKDHEDLRRRCNEVTVSLRKVTRAVMLFKRRNVGRTLFRENNNNAKASILNIDEIKVAINDSSNPERQYMAIYSARKFLGNGSIASIDIVIEAGLLKKLTSFLSLDEVPKLLYEAAWALCIIASGNSKQTEAVVKAGALPHLIKLLSSKDEKVCRKAVCILANISGDGPKMRDRVLKGVVRPLVTLTEKQGTSRFLKKALAWIFSNLINIKPRPRRAVVRKCLGALMILMSHKNKDMQADIYWTFVYFTHENDEFSKDLYYYGIAAHFLKALDSRELRMMIPALHSLNNLAYVCHRHRSIMMQDWVFPRITKVLTDYHTNPVMLRCAGQMIATLATDPDNIQRILDSGVMAPLIRVLDGGTFKPQLSATWAIANLATTGTDDQVMAVFHMNVVPPLCKLLAAKDDMAVMVVFNGLLAILDVAKKLGQVESVTEVIEQCGGRDKIEALEEHKNSDIYDTAMFVLETYFEKQAEEDVVQSEASANSYECGPADGQGI